MVAMTSAVMRTASLAVLAPAPEAAKSRIALEEAVSVTARAILPDKARGGHART